MVGASPELILATCVDNNGPMLLGVGWGLLVFALLCLSLRLWFRHVGKGLGLDDYTMILSGLCGTIAIILLVLFVNAGLGRHIYCLPKSQLPLVFKYSIICQILNIAGIGLIKISVCLHILRIIDRGGRPYLSIFLWALIAFAAASHLAQILLFCVQCRPMHAIWDFRLQRAYGGTAKCFSPHITYLAGYIGFGLDAFTDIVCALIPIFVINRLQMNARQKAGLCLLMGLGSLTAACAIAKSVTLKALFEEDYTWVLWRPAICTIVEHLAGMVLACVPALNPLFKRALGQPSGRFGSWRSYERGSNGSKNSSRRTSRWGGTGPPTRPHSAWTSLEDRRRRAEKYDNTLATQDSETTAASSERTVVGGSLVGGERKNEITKTISFRLSEHNSDHGNAVTEEIGEDVDVEAAGGDRLWTGQYLRIAPLPGSASTTGCGAGTHDQGRGGEGQGAP